MNINERRVTAYEGSHQGVALAECRRCRGRGYHLWLLGWACGRCGGCGRVEVAGLHSAQDRAELLDLLDDANAKLRRVQALADEAERHADTPAAPRTFDGTIFPAMVDAGRIRTALEGTD